MKFSHLFGSLVLVGVAAAQAFNIAAPVSGQNLKSGKTFTVEVDQPVSAGVFIPVSVVIGLQRCGASPCPADDNNGILGQILFAGDYSPTRHENFKPPYQNYTLTIDDITSGSAVLHVVQLALIGAGPFPILTSKNVTVSIVGKPTSSAKFKQ
ncbi:hypothetical protein BU17DRAFT_70716 [Hysterangium stoloniferum]|nr:hypothetical protein BU17DRAFT_70716 [Hysterangium stoloniferum]